MLYIPQKIPWRNQRFPLPLIRQKQAHRVLHPHRLIYSLSLRTQLIQFSKKSVQDLTMARSVYGSSDCFDMSSIEIDEARFGCMATVRRVQDLQSSVKHSIAA